MANTTPIELELANSAKLNPLTATSENVTYEGKSRQGMVFTFDPDTVTFDELQAAFTENNCEKIKISDAVSEDDVSSPREYIGYALLAGISQQRKVIGNSLDDNGYSIPEYGDVYVVSLARRTYEEIQLRKLQASVDSALLLALGAN